MTDRPIRHVDPNPVVRLWQAMERRDWQQALDCVAPDAQIRWPATGERFTGPDFVAMNRAYPEGWSIEIVESLRSGDRVSAQVRVTHGGEVHWCAGFYTVEGSRIVDGVEYWVTEGADDPSAWRSRFAAR
jgi:hypothetical protein